MNNLYTVKNLLEEAKYLEETANKAFQKRTKANMSLGNRLIGKAIRLEAEAENLYYDIVGAKLHHKELCDLFGIQ